MLLLRNTSILSKCIYICILNAQSTYLALVSVVFILSLDDPANLVSLFFVIFFAYISGPYLNLQETQLKIIIRLGAVA